VYTPSDAYKDATDDDDVTEGTPFIHPFVHHVSVKAFSSAAVTAQDTHWSVNTPVEVPPKGKDMLGARASRITDAASSRAAPKQQARLEPTLSPVQRINRWRVMTRKLIIVLDAFHYTNCVMAAIGERPYKTIFGSLRQTQVANAAETKMAVHKILDGQIMGKELGYSKAQKLPAAGTRTEPTLCQHNPINIRQGANGRSKSARCAGNGSQSQNRARSQIPWTS
jgi:hypothetical protein